MLKAAKGEKVGARISTWRENLDVET